MALPYRCCNCVSDVHSPIFMKSHTLVSYLFRQFFIMWSHMPDIIHNPGHNYESCLTCHFITLFIDLIRNHSFSHFCSDKLMFVALRAHIFSVDLICCLTMHKVKYTSVTSITVKWCSFVNHLLFVHMMLCVILGAKSRLIYNQQGCFKVLLQSLRESHTACSAVHVYINKSKKIMSCSVFQIHDKLTSTLAFWWTNKSFVSHKKNIRQCSCPTE